MTNAIEQAKREMYAKLSFLHGGSSRPIIMASFESAMESYLELLRQDHEALHETARKRFEDLQVAEAANQDLIEKLSLMTTDRDSMRNRMQAKEAREASASTSGQTSGDRASCATPDAKTMALLGALVDAQRVIVDYLVPDGIRAKNAIGKLIPILDNQKLVIAMRQFEVEPRCMHSFFAIGDDQMKCTFCGVGK